MKKHIKKLIIMLIFFQFISCKDYYNDTIKWMDSIEFGTLIQTVKYNQPDFLTVDWENPQQFDGNKKGYLVTDIKGNHDILSMNHYLVFNNDKFERRDSHK